ncbi:MAG: DsbA family protein [Myxococcota bacterium]|nr:DsbA family protein [Myxococcota bacterium]
MGCSAHQGAIDLEHAARLGTEAAPIEIIVFSDFQCPYCKRAAAALQEIYGADPRGVRIFFKHYPLSYHPQAMNAAKAAEAARLQGKFWEMHDALFAHASGLSDPVYIELAKKIGLDIDRFSRDMASRHAAKRVLSDRDEGHSIGVTGTPYILVDRYTYIGPVSNLPRYIAEYKQSK